MTWRLRLRTASFRGAKFFVDSHDYGFGRRNQVHQYPFQEDAYVEDLGQEADEFTINCYVIQQYPILNYFSARDKLIDALKEQGPGKLIHRYLGEKYVAVTGKVRMTETFNEGGIARFTITFTEAGKNQFPSQAVNPKGAVDISALDAIARGLDEFGEYYNTAQSAVNDLNTMMVAVTALIKNMVGVPATVINAATSIVTNATNTFNSVANSPCDLGDSIGAAFESFELAAGMTTDSIDREITGGCSGRTQNPEDAIRNADDLTTVEGVSIALASASCSILGTIRGSSDVTDEVESTGGILSPINVTSPASAARQSSRQSSINLLRLNGIAQACRVAVRTEFNSQQDAEELMLNITGRIDDFLEYLGNEAGDESLAGYNVNFSNDETYQALKALKPVFVDSMNQIGADLAKTIEYKVQGEPLNTLVLAYDRYEDLDREQEIIDRNTVILNPAFIPNTTIDILSE